jgi:hypothetical protein
MKISFENLIDSKTLWLKPVYSYHKSGNILIIAGSRDKSFVPIQIAESAIKAGSSNLIIAYPETLKFIYKDLMPIEYSRPLPQTMSGSLSYKAKSEIINLTKQSTIAIVGPSLGNNAETLHLIWDIITNTNITKIIGGSAISALIMGISALKKNDIDPSLHFNNNGHNIFILEESEVLTLIELIYGKEERKEFSKKAEALLLNMAKFINGTIIAFYKDEIFIVDSLVLKIDKISGELYKNIIYGVMGSFLDKNPSQITQAIKTAIYICEKSVQISEKDNSNPSTASVIKNIKKAILEAENKAFKD